MAETEFIQQQTRWSRGSVALRRLAGAPSIFSLLFPLLLLYDSFFQFWRQTQERSPRRRTGDRDELQPCGWKTDSVRAKVQPCSSSTSDLIFYFQNPAGDWLFFFFFWLRAVFHHSVRLKWQQDKKKQNSDNFLLVPPRKATDSPS